MYALKIFGKILLGLLVLLVLFVLALALMPAFKQTTQIDFTRHVAQYKPGDEAPSIHQDFFFGVPGSARAIVSTTGMPGSASVQLNGLTVVAPKNFDGSGQFEIPVSLKDNNTLTVALGGAAGDSITVRIKQAADIEMHVASRVHFNTNVSNFTAAREFYGELGFSTVTGFPDTNTLAMAQAIGIETPTSYDGSKGGTAGGYLLHGELIGLGGFAGGVIDLIEFTIPRNEAAPYAKINHLGMAKAAMLTTDLAADYDYMKRIGVDFISEPAALADGTKFAIFKDQDGTYYELIEVDGAVEETETTHITKLSHLNINVSDFERSRAWYQMLGYDVTQELPRSESITASNALGFAEPVERQGAILTHANDDSTIELVQWISPYDPDAAYDIPINHLGIHRTAFTSGNIDADVATLKAQGVEFVSEVTPCCSGPESSGSIVAFYDPDGTIVELVGQPRIMTNLLSFLGWLM